MVCYCPDSGDTHLINAEAAEILRTLGRHPIAEAGLRETLSLDSEAASGLGQLLADLARVDLVSES
ncbi:HPr-rel-A system PqqD family peptide chaperone [Parahaliea mediterranea]|uniref:HPr-rel-A system PqqD family peptide chaperone n=1 Tax=Parahaliea mediterranea TaxID=651086 RepID=A0A939IKL7_9GAMM|nr:HPr-rel-A system PqqD family peptide chaperone [Parahaliea mediterranea]